MFAKKIKDRMANLTTDYINKFNALYNPSKLSCCSCNPKTGFSGGVFQWIHDHPTTTKVMQIAGLILGCAALISAPFSLPVLGVAFTASVGVIGGLFLLSSLATWLCLKYVTCAKHDMKQHVYQEIQYGQSRLYYRGDIPVLEMDGTSEECGQVHGYLLGPQICALKNNLDLALHGIMRLPCPDRLQKVLDAVYETIPESLQQEMQGLVNGYNEWAQKAKKSSMTIGDALLMHLIADSKHFHPKQVEKSLLQMPEDQAAACTVLLDRDQEGRVLFGRNMDWCPFGKGGSYSLVFVWKQKGVAALGVPGLIGAVTGWNRDKLSLAINVCPGDTQTVRGMPAILYNRYILENAKTVARVKELIRAQRPLGPYHMSVADAQNHGACISFYQDRCGGDHIRDLEESPIQVLNWNYPACEEGYFHSQIRCRILTGYYNTARRWEIQKNTVLDRRALIANALTLSPYINTWITMHSLIMEPVRGQVQMSWDNGFAASQPNPANVPMTEFFEPSPRTN